MVIFERFCLQRRKSFLALRTVRQWSKLQRWAECSYTWRFFKAWLNKDQRNLVWSCSRLFQLQFSNNSTIFCQGKRRVSFCSSEKHCSSNGNDWGQYLCCRTSTCTLFSKCRLQKTTMTFSFMFYSYILISTTTGGFLLRSKFDNNFSWSSFCYLWSFLLCLLGALSPKFSSSYYVADSWPMFFP